MTIRSKSQSRAAKAKGREAENLVCEYLSRHLGKTVERRRLTGDQDCGDVAGIDGWVIEIKNQKTMNLSGWLDESMIEAHNAAIRFCGMYRSAVIHKRRGKKNAAEWFITMELSQWQP